MISPTLIEQFVFEAVQTPAISLADVRRRLDTPDLLAARKEVAVLVQSNGEARFHADAAGDMVQALAYVRSRRAPGSDREAKARDAIDAILPLLHAVCVREFAAAHPAIQPMIDLATAVAPHAPW
jgi:hypothetical protein